jgi:TRAP-type C4-dicarboxylate transport system permease small subunit
VLPSKAESPTSADCRLIARVLSIASLVLSRAQQVLIILSALGLILGVVTMVLLRYVVQVKFFGTEEIILMAAAWFYFIAASYASYKGKYIRGQALDFFIKSEESLIRDIIGILFPFIGFCVCAITCYWAFNYLAWTFSSNIRTVTLGWPFSFSVMSMVVGMAILTIYLLVELVKSVQNAIVKHAKRRGKQWTR